MWNKTEQRWPDIRAKMNMSEYTTAETIQLLKKSAYQDKLERGTWFVNDLFARDFFEYTYKPEDFLDRCSYVLPNTYTIVDTDCHAIFDITTYFKEAFKCYSLKTKEAMKYDYSSLQRIKGCENLRNYHT